VEPRDICDVSTYVLAVLDHVIGLYDAIDLPVAEFEFFLEFVTAFKSE
jgi:hypothetical protein